MRRFTLAMLMAACGGNALPVDPLEGTGQTVGAVKDPYDLHGAPEPQIHLRREYAGRGGGSTLMTLHNGYVMPTHSTYAIWWGPEWTDSSNLSFGGSDKIAGMETFFKGFGGSSYALASSEYYGVDKKHVTGASTFGGSFFDTSAAPSKAPSVSGAVAEVCKMTNNAPDAGGIYFLYTSTGAGAVNYCAWHSYGTCSNGAKVQVAYMPNIDGIAGCDPQDTYGTGHSEGLAALANVTAHEQSETMTDPRNGGWYDNQKQENGDKCAWAFNGPVTFSTTTTTTDADGGVTETTTVSSWKLQGEWSNAAYSAGTGFPNRSGQKGCLP